MDIFAPLDLGMGTRLIRSNKFVAVLLAVDGALNGIYLYDVLFVVPFAIAAFQFYMTPITWKLRRWLVFFTVVVVALSLGQGLSFFIEGAVNGGSMTLVQGVSLLIVNALILASFVVSRGAEAVQLSTK
jgi:hypothetical protein